MPCEHMMPRFLENKNRWTHVSCGNCTSCRIGKMQEWKLRLLMEQQYHDDSCFITLTYDNEHLEHLPNSRQSIITSHGEIIRKSLDFDDLSKFWKRLREDLDHPIKFYASGEYGEKINYPSAYRPHFHAIVYGLGVNSQTRNLLKDNWRFCDSYRFDGIKAGLAYAESDSMLYVSSYVRKKLVGKLGKQEYQDKGLIPPDSRCSQGIAYQWYLDNRNKVLKDLHVTFQGRVYPIPRYFVKKDEILKEKLENAALRYKFKKLQEYGYSVPEILAIASSRCLDEMVKFPYGENAFDESAHQNNLNIETKLSLFKKQNILEVSL